MFKEEMAMMMWRLLVIFFVGCIFYDTANAKTTFLPDWMDSDLTTKKFDGNPNQDEDFCAESGLYHKATSCPAPKIFDEFCPYDDGWISDCYCPDIFANNCSAPYRGDERKTDGRTGYASCDDKWVACCDTTCPGNTSLTDPGGCGGSTVNACGDTCYYPYEPCCEPLADETNCKYGEETCSDGCDGTRTCCKACEPLVDVDVSTCEYGTVSCDDGCGGTRTCCKACEPLVDVDVSNCEYGTVSCDDVCGGTRKCCGTCTPLSSVKSEDCDWGTKSCSDGCDGTRTCCKSCEDNGGSSSCTGQVSKCGENQTEVSTCMNCSGTKLYICEDKPEEAACSGNSECVVGAIYYTDGTCCSELISSKSVAGVVVKDYKLVMWSKQLSSKWNSKKEDLSVLTNYTSSVPDYQAKSDYSGKSNTAAIVGYYGSSATDNAAVVCYNYAPEGMEDSKTKWYMPATGELYEYVHTNYPILASTYVDLLGWSKFDSSFWSSTEKSSSYAWEVYSAGDSLYDYDKTYSQSLGCFLEINASSASKTCQISSCVVGSIYYSDKTCSSCLISSKTPVGIVVKDNDVVVALNIAQMEWTGRTSVSGITNDTYASEAKTRYNGKENTTKIVTQYGASATEYAGVYCYNYAPNGMSSSKGSWYLPDVGELNDYLYANYAKVKKGWNQTNTKVPHSDFWSSAQRYGGDAWHVNVVSGNVSYVSKSYDYSVGCFLKI